MASNLGSAEFILRADAAQLIRALDDSQRKVAATTAKIAQDLGVSERSVTQAANQIAKAQESQAAGWGNVAKSTVGVITALAGVTVGLAAVKAGMDASVAATLKAEQAQRTLGAAYGQSAGQFKAFADAQAVAFRRTNSEVEAGVARMAILQKQYGITSVEIEKLTHLALNLGTTFGDTSEAIRSVQAAIRGEPEALEKYGIALQENAIKNSQLLTEEQRKNFTSLDAVTQARLRYKIILAEGAQYEGAATERAATAQGSFDRLTRATDEAAKSIGERLVPKLAAAADGIATYLEKSKGVEARNAELATSFEDFARRYTTALGPLSAIGFFDLVTGRGSGPSAPGAGVTTAPATPTGPELGPSKADVKAIQDQLISEERERQKRIADIRKEARDAQAKAGTRAAEEEHDREVKALDAKKILIEVERDERLKALEERTKATLASIETESRAAADASEAQINRLQAEQETAKRASSERHDQALAALDVEQRAAEAAVDERLRQIEIEKETATRASEEKRDTAIDALDAEKRARDAARVEEDRAAEDSAQAAKRREDDRHEAVIEGFEGEVKAANDSKDRQLRNLDELSDKAQRKHEDRLRHLSDEAEAARDEHDARVREIEDEADADQERHERAVRAIDDQGKAAEAVHAATLRRLDAEGDAARDAHDVATRAGEDEQRAAERIHDQRMAQIDDEAAAAEHAHDQLTRAIEDEGRAAGDVHEQLLRAIADEGDEAERIHDQALRAISERGDAEDELHRQNMANLDDEQRQREDALDNQLAALDALDRAASDAATAARLAGAVEGAKRGVQKAESTGNLSEIEAAQRELAEAQQAILDHQAKSQRDATREQLKTQKDAIKEEIDARKDAESERSRILKQELADEKQAADDRLKLVKDGLDARKQAADDEYRLVKDGLDARKRAADDAYALIRDELEARREAAAAAYTLVTDDVAARKLAADDALKVVTDRLEKERQAEDDAHKAGQDRRANQKQALDDTYKQSQRRRADEKQDLDDQLDQALDRIDAQRKSEDDAYEKTKQRLEKRKQAIGDANKDELDKIAARKKAEDDAHDNAVRQAQDQATQEKRAVQDRRTAEDQADAARRDQVQKAFENEARDRKARYDDEATGEIPALRRSLEAAREHFRQRKLDADAAYDAEQQQIADTYTHPETGLIPLAQKAAREVQQKYSDMARDVNTAAQAQKAAIDNVYTNASRTGLLDYLERARADSQDKLDKQKQYWQDWAEDLAGPNGQIKKVIDRFDSLIGRIKEAGGTVNVRGDGRSSYGDSGDDRGGHGPGPGVGSNAVPDPYQVSFPFGARYSNPFNASIPVHRGVDLTVKGARNGGKGHPVEAFEDGQVIYDAYDPNGGNGIIIRGDDGLFHRYFHFDSTSVRNGQRVSRGDVIGRLGETGTEGSPHLHYEVSHNAGGDPIGDLIDPVPYMSRGGGGRSAGGRTFEFDLFGRHFVISLPGGARGEALIRAIEQLGTEIGGRDFGRAAAAIALSEGADGDLSEPGAGGARGPFQFDPGGELPHYADYLNKSLRDAGDYAGDHPLEAAAWALHGYLGDALRSGLAQDPPLKGADLAEWGSYYGQRPAEELWRRAGSAHRLLYGYERGGWIDRPTLLVDERTSQPYARAGEGGHPEWVGRVTNGGRADGPVEHQQINVMLGNQTLETISVTGIKLAVRRGLTLSDLGLSA